MVQIATELGCDPAEAALRLYERAEAAVIARAMQDADVEAIACHPLIAVGSDGSSLSASGVLSVGKPHPRSYGTNPRFLAQFVRQRRLMSLPEAIRKMTTLPASRLGLTDVGGSHQATPLIWWCLTRTRSLTRPPSRPRTAIPPVWHTWP